MYFVNGSCPINGLISSPSLAISILRLDACGSSSITHKKSFRSSVLLARRRMSNSEGFSSS